MKDHHLNEEDILQEFRESKGMRCVVDIPSFQGPRMNWLVEVACAILINHEVYLDYLHRLRYCTVLPNKLVVADYEGLSDHTAMAGLAARAIYCVEVSEVSVFFWKALAMRWELDDFYNLVVAALEGNCQRGELLNSLKITFPEFEDEIERSAESQLEKVNAVYEAAKVYDNQWPHFMARACPAVIACVQEHRDANVRGDSTTRDGFVSSCYIESFLAS